MSYIAASDVRDDLVTSATITASDLSDVDAYLDDLATEFDTTVASPLSYRAKQLAIAKCIVIVCTRKTGVSVRGQSSDGVDSWEVKRRIYQKFIDGFTVTASDLSGVTSDVGESNTINLYRG